MKLLIITSAFYRLLQYIESKIAIYLTQSAPVIG